MATRGQHALFNATCGSCCCCCRVSAAGFQFDDADEELDFDSLGYEVGAAALLAACELAALWCLAEQSSQQPVLSAFAGATIHPSGTAIGCDSYPE